MGRSESCARQDPLKNSSPFPNSSLKSFRFRAVNEEGHILKSRGIGIDDQDIRRQLFLQGYMLLSFKEIRYPKLTLRRMSSIKDQELEEFCHHVSALDQAGVPLLDILSAYGRWNKTLRVPLLTVIEGLKQGHSLATAFALAPRFFSPLFCALVAATAHLGSWTPGFDELAHYYKWRQDFKDQLWKSLRYPLLLLLLMGGLVILLITWVLPQLSLFLEALGQDLPFSTRLLLFCARHSTPLCLGFGCLVLGTLLIFKVARTLSSLVLISTDHLLLKMPFCGKLISKMALQHFLSIFKAFLHRGLPVLEALATATDQTNNAFLRQQFSIIQTKIQQGSCLSQAWLTTPSLDPRVGCLLETGELSGQLGKPLQQGILFLRRDIDTLTQRMITFFEPVILIILGGTIMWLMMAVLHPLYDQMTLLEE